MSSLSSLYIKRETLKTLLDTLDKKGEKGIELTIGISDQSNEWGQNLSAYVSQSKEDREAKKPRYYTGNGKVFWTDGKISVAQRQDNNQPAQTPYADDDDSGLPF